MLNNKELSKEKPPTNQFWQYIRKSGFTMVMVILIGVLFVSPDAKSFLLRQLMATGIFNASIDKKDTDTVNQVNSDFNFFDEKGNVVNTSSLRGKVVFINFWASWCPPCRAEFPSIEKLYSTFKDHPDFFFLTINEDNDIAVAREYLNREKFSVPLYRSSGNVPAEIYAGSLPTTLVLDKTGKIRFHHTGFANYTSEKFIEQMKELMED